MRKLDARVGGELVAPVSRVSCPFIHGRIWEEARHTSVDAKAVRKCQGTLSLPLEAFPYSLLPVEARRSTRQRWIKLVEMVRGPNLLHARRARAIISILVGSPSMATRQQGVP